MNPQKVWGAFCSSWIGVFGPPSSIQTDEGGEWKNELWAELRSERRIKLLFQDVGAHPWILGRRYGPARGIYNRLKVDARVPGKQILAGARWRLNTLISREGSSANRRVSRSNPVDLYGLEDRDEDSAFAQDTS